uniref:Uncharacterized protein n=1 Tax=Tetradesmus obliquus TaxID=3088 RepID=A0A383VG63_TETOB|eukprot:jgi/Sobl393_1/1580/SZX64191.1
MPAPGPTAHEAPASTAAQLDVAAVAPGPALGLPAGDATLAVTTILPATPEIGAPGAPLAASSAPGGQPHAPSSGSVMRPPSQLERLAAEWLAARAQQQSVQHISQSSQHARSSSPA